MNQYVFIWYLYFLKSTSKLHIYDTENIFDPYETVDTIPRTKITHWNAIFKIAINLYFSKIERVTIRIVIVDKWHFTTSIAFINHNQWLITSLVDKSALFARQSTCNVHLTFHAIIRTYVFLSLFLQYNQCSFTIWLQMWLAYEGSIRHIMKATREFGSAPVCDSYSPTYNLSHREKRAINCIHAARIR